MFLRLEMKTRNLPGVAEEGRLLIRVFLHSGDLYQILFLIKLTSLFLLYFLHWHSMMSLKHFKLIAHRQGPQRICLLIQIILTYSMLIAICSEVEIPNFSLIISFPLVEILLIITVLPTF